MRWSFRTNGNYIDFVHTDETSEAVESTIFHLHNTSRCVSWSLPSDTTRINFTIDEVKYSNILITDIDFDGTVMNSQDDFETGITGMFAGLAGGGGGGVESVTAGDASITVGGTATEPTVKLPYKIYTARLTQAGTSNPVATVLGGNTIGEIVWTRNDVGQYQGELTGAFPSGRTIAPPFDLTVDSGCAAMQPVYNATPNAYSYQLVRGTNNIVNLNFYNNADFAYVEWSSVPSPNGIIVQIMVYPA